MVPEAVKFGILYPPKDGEYDYRTGKTREDLYLFLVFRMYHWKHFNGPSGSLDGTNKDKDAVVSEDSNKKVGKSIEDADEPSKEDGQDNEGDVNSTLTSLDELFDLGAVPTFLLAGSCSSSGVHLLRKSTESISLT